MPLSADGCQVAWGPNALKNADGLYLCAPALITYTYSASDGETRVCQFMHNLDRKYLGEIAIKPQ